MADRREPSPRLAGSHEVRNAAIAAAPPVVAERVA
jgi:hypothetical protein